MKLTNKYILDSLFIILTLALLKTVVENLLTRFGCDSFNISEFLINYEGGFCRRGLAGQALLYFVRWTGFDVETTIKVFCLICMVLVTAFFIICFRKKGYCLYLLPLCFCLGGLIVSSAGAYYEGDYPSDWIRKDFLLLGVFIVIATVQIKARFGFRLKVLIINLLSVVAILTHEGFAFLFIPLIFILFCSELKSEKPDINRVARYALGALALLPSVVALALTAAFRGNQQNITAIWQSWQPFVGDTSSFVDSPYNAVTALGWDTAELVKSYLKINFMLFDHGIVSSLYWALVFPVFYYVFTNALLVLVAKPDVFSSSDRNRLSGLLLFQMLCFIPLFVFLYTDYIRLCFYLTGSSLAVFLLMPADRLDGLFPEWYKKLVVRINNGFDSLLKPTRGVVAILMLTIGIAFYSFSINSVVESTAIYQILSFLAWIGGLFIP
jgi:hypothetical protein